MSEEDLMSKMLLWHSKYISDKSGGFSRYLMTNPLVRRWGYSLNMLLLLICSIKRFDMYPVGRCGIVTPADRTLVHQSKCGRAGVSVDHVNEFTLHVIIDGAVSGESLGALCRCL